MYEESQFDDEIIPLIETKTSKTTPSSNLKEIRGEFFLLIKIAIPIILTNLSTFLILTESTIMTGQLTKIDLDACALANSVVNVAGLAISIGLCTACDTFFSQMYGSKHRKSIGMVLIKCIMIISLFPIVLIAFHINMEPLFILMRQHPEVSQKAGWYMTLFSPGLLFGFNFLILTRYMQNQNRVLPPMIIGITVNIFNVTSQYLTVYYFDFGYKASAVCQAVTFFLFWLIQLLYILISKLYEETWNGWTRESFLDWFSFLRLAIPGAAVVVMECFCFEIGTILSGIMGPVELAAQSVMFQLETITFMISFGVGIAVNIRVGQFLGSGNEKSALKAYRCGLLLIFLSFCITTSLTLGLRFHLPSVFTNDKEAQELSAELLPYVAGVQFLDAMGTVTMGALRGCGRQKICVLIIFFSYYLLGQPIGISLAFAAGMKVQGLWVGLLISLAICVPIAVIYTNFIQNWKIQATLCQQRITEAMKDQASEEILIEASEKLSFRDGQLHTSHTRSLSKSFSVKGQGERVITKYIEVDIKIYKKAYIQKLSILVFVLCILLGGVFVHIYLPRQLYYPQLNVTVK